MNPVAVIICSVIFGMLPLIVCSILSIRQWTFGLWLFSPLPTFIFAYGMAFGFVPMIETLYGLKIYPDMNVSEQSFFAGEVLGVAACWAFAAGFLSYNRRLNKPSSSTENIPIPDAAKHKAINQQRILFLLVILMQIVFALYLLSVGALTSNFAQNRHNYLDSLLGSGYINMMDQLSCNILMMGLLFYLWTKRIGKLGLIALLTFTFTNFLITNRGIITSLFYLLIFTYFLQSIRKAVKIKPARLIAMLGVIVSLGAIIGLSRGIGNTDIQEDSNSPTELAFKSFPPVISGVIFLSYTFDMGVLLDKAVEKNDPLEWGSTWYEDIAYTFLPRAIFPDKPILYGSTRLQNQVAPEIYGGDINISATYPIGIFGESYANFGIPGVIIVLFLLGRCLNFWFTRCLHLSADREVNWSSLTFMVLYATICSSSLPYIRSLGMFLAVLLFMVFLMLLVIGVVRWISNSIENSHPSYAHLSSDA